MKEHECALVGTNKLTKLIAEAYPSCEVRDIWVWFQSGINTDGAHNAVTTKSLQDQDILSFNMMAQIDGYYVALERTAVFNRALESARC